MCGRDSYLRVSSINATKVQNNANKCIILTMLNTSFVLPQSQYSPLEHKSKDSDQRYT